MEEAKLIRMATAISEYTISSMLRETASEAAETLNKAAPTARTLLCAPQQLLNDIAEARAVRKKRSFLSERACSRCGCCTDRYHAALAPTQERGAWIEFHYGTTTVNRTPLVLETAAAGK